MVGIVRVLGGRRGSRTFFTSSGEIEIKSSQTARCKSGSDLLIQTPPSLPRRFALLVNVVLHHGRGDVFEQHRSEIGP